MDVRIWQVGGSIRDEIMGIKPHDIDYAVEAESFGAMRDYIINAGGEIFLERPEFVTIRARINRDTFDYVLCRKDGFYSDGRRPDKVIPGSILDDLSRRDFTINAIAKNAVTGEIFDPFGGIQDIGYRLIRCVGNAKDRINEDALRLLRAVRFSITKNLIIDAEIMALFTDDRILTRLSNSVSPERIREEIYKIFACNTIAAIGFFANFYKFSAVCFSDTGIWLKPTSEKK